MNGQAVAKPHTASRPPWVWLPLLLCWIIVLALLVVRGVAPGEHAYGALQAARDPGLSHLSGPYSPLYLALLAGAARFGAPVPSTGLALSAAGWLAAIAAVYLLGLRFNRTALAIFAAGALTLDPTLPTRIGQDTLFVAGWLWGALATLPYPIPASQSARWRLTLPNWMAILALVALTVSIAWHARQAAAPVLWQTYSPTLLPGLALLAGWCLDKLSARLLRLPVAWSNDEQIAFQVILVVLTLMGLGYLRGTAQAWSSTSQQVAVERLALWEQAGLWLQKNTSDGSSVWSDENNVLRYWSERRVVGAASPNAPPDYCVAINSLSWKEQISRPWFQEHYRRVTAIATPHDSLDPLAIYRYRSSPFDLGAVVNVGARLGGVIELESFRLDSPHLIPGEAQHLTLTWRALEQLTRTFYVRVRLYEPASRRVLAQVEHAAPANVKTRLWPVGRPLTDRYTLEIPGDLAAGFYPLEVQVLYAENEALPAPNFDHPLDEAVTLAQLEAQPWTSLAPLGVERPLVARWGDSIELQGYSLRAASLSPVIVERGGLLRVRLYWRALAAPAGAYHVFVHLLTLDGRLAAQHDSIPVYGTYPTNEWRAGEYVLDEHPIPIEPATPPGRYLLKVGLYDIASGERQAVRDSSGQLAPDRSLLLTPVDVE